MFTKCTEMASVPGVAEPLFRIVIQMTTHTQALICVWMAGASKQDWLWDLALVRPNMAP